MINGIGPTGGRIDAARVQNGQKSVAAVSLAADVAVRESSSASTPAALLAESGPPVDADRIAAVRALIAEGRYKIDPNAIAGKMVEMDLAEQKASGTK